MAKNLNKSRIRDSKIIVVLALLIVFLTKALIPSTSEMHEVIEYLGYFLVAICALGRVYSTAFLGGHKNQTLITYGAFSVVRNPLYFFSLLGMTGVALISGYITIMVVLPVFFIALYHFLITREEVFLVEEFGEEYKAYMGAVPRLLPRLSLYKAPELVEVNPKFLAKSFKDAIWWFAAFPLLEFAEYLQHSEVIRPFVTLP
jgi:protein-S-isoprenylcysteine O-methyltransferase Ste14